MPQPKRIYLENYIYFITTNTHNRIKLFDNQVNYDLLIKILSACQKRYKYKIYGYVVMPDHVHLLIQPDDIMSISECMHRIKGNFAYQYIKTRNREGSATRHDEKFNRVGNLALSNRVGDPLRVAGIELNHNPDRKSVV